MFTRIYALAVCFASMMCIAIATGVALFDLLQVAVPHLTMGSHEMRAEQMVFATPGGRMMFNDAMPGAQAPRELSDEEREQRRAEWLASSIERERHNAVSSLLHILAILVVSIPLFAVHWRLARRLDAQASSG